MDSDNEENASDDDSSGSEEESSVGSGSSSDTEFDPYDQYYSILQRLRDERRMSVAIILSEVFDILLDSVDEFIQALTTRTATRLTSLSLGNRDFYDGRKLEISKKNTAAWNKFFTALANLETVQRVDIGAFNLSGEIMGRIVTSLPDVTKIEITLPWISLNGDMSMLEQALSNHTCQAIELKLGTEMFEHEEERQAFLSAGIPNHFDDGGIASQLISVNGLSEVHFKSIKLSLNECRAFARILSSGAISSSYLGIDNCTFADNGGLLIARGFRDNTSLKRLYLANSFREQNFCEALISSLPFNTSILDLRVHCDRFVAPLGVNDFELELAKTLAIHNKTLKNMLFADRDNSLYLTGLDELELAIQQNYTLESINYHGWSPYHAITRLNKAGRKYLADDANSNSKCIAVLAKVKHDLDCLYFHLRENPILCMSFAGRTGEMVDRKRKADDLDSTR